MVEILRYSIQLGNEDWKIEKKDTLAIAMVPRAFLLPSRSSWSAASRTRSLVFSSSIRHCNSSLNYQKNA